MISILPENIVMHLHNIRFIGNTAAHEQLECTHKKSFVWLSEDFEDIMNYLYELNYKASLLTKYRQSH